MSRLVIGLGFRDRASAQSLHDVLANVVAQADVQSAETVLAVAQDKVTHPSLLAMLEATKLPIEIASHQAMQEADARVTTRSAKVELLRGVGSVCEAAALAVAGLNSRLVVSRTASSDRNATAAAALVEDIAS